VERKTTAEIDEVRIGQRLKVRLNEDVYDRLLQRSYSSLGHLQLLSSLSVPITSVSSTGFSPIKGRDLQPNTYDLIVSAGTEFFSARSETILIRLSAYRRYR
jgi:hypothetical protein